MTEALVADVPVPAYPLALILIPLVFAVHVTLVAAVFKPSASAEIPIVLPLELMLILLPEDKLDVAGAEIAICEALVPDSVMLIPDRLSVLPDAVVLPEVFPDRLAYMTPPAAAVR